MTDHAKLFEIVQKVFNAGQKFRIDTDLAITNGRKFPAAYPVITPLIAELVQYCNEQIKSERDACASIVWLRSGSSGIAGKIAQDIEHRNLTDQIKPARPSSPFRSVEIVDGELK